ncbi:hypothetical protein IFM89_002626 [Coptis chinensis]|uniref:Uncharacterized protein n=1 Tax=Coptis chinensis TaxID=261450 RepID=A0A835GVW5_9MAGN|nr:hypothetical protein IFM89_002626 [Coptis chinensis]
MGQVPSQNEDAKPKAVEQEQNKPLPTTSKTTEVKEKEGKTGQVPSQNKDAKPKPVKQEQNKPVLIASKTTEKYWIEKETGLNCFMLYARDLLITWAEDKSYWHWPCLNDTSEVNVDVAELLNVCWLEVHGKFSTSNLSPNTMYEVLFLVKLIDPAYGWEVPVNLRLMLPNGETKEHKESLLTKPRAQWIELQVGEFYTSPDKLGDMEISMFEYEGGTWKKGLVIKGVVIRPKKHSSSK